MGKLYKVKTPYCSFISATSLIKNENSFKNYEQKFQYVEVLTPLISSINCEKSIKNLEFEDNYSLTENFSKKFQFQDIDRFYFISETICNFQNNYFISLYCRLKGETPIYAYIFYKYFGIFDDVKYRGWYTDNPDVFYDKFSTDIYLNNYDLIINLFKKDCILFTRLRNINFDNSEGCFKRIFRKKQ